jgi:hypothetical protein
MVWARSKGFDETVVTKFQGKRWWEHPGFEYILFTTPSTSQTEHEISGDVLLELDANLLKELEIPQFGKRVKIANAIAELRRPASQASVGNGSYGTGSRGPSVALSPASVVGHQYAYSEGMPSFTQSPVTGSFPTTPIMGLPQGENFRRPYASTPPLEQRDSDTVSSPGGVDTRRASDFGLAASQAQERGVQVSSGRVPW